MEKRKEVRRRENGVWRRGKRCGEEKTGCGEDKIGYREEKSGCGEEETGCGEDETGYGEERLYFGTTIDSIECVKYKTSYDDPIFSFFECI